MNPFEEILRLMLQFHLLMNAGQGNTHEADKLQDQIDPLWDKCSDKEREVLGLVSEALTEQNSIYKKVINA